MVDGGGGVTQWWQHSVISEYIVNFSRRFLKNGRGSISFHDGLLETVVEATCFHDGLQRPSWKHGPSTTVFRERHGSCASTTVFGNRFPLRVFA
ncbi:hypothetical protein TIFTF001_033056 [Ficus carica]|uniref:Uncharacterized protein n=1 Tax=Ficus carica TaxID=3494 RepID=A0AA88J7G2_FICCA|nr:hypothetical protein TIFTF001_033056 [Ficus carica]